MWCEELTRWKNPWCWERLKVGGEGDDRGWDGCMASLTRWTWIWASSGRWWGTGKPGVLQSMGFTESDTTEQLNHNKASTLTSVLCAIINLHFTSMCVKNLTIHCYKFLLVNHVLKKCFKLEKNLSYYIFNISVSFILLCRCKFPSCIPFLPSEELPVTFAVVVCWQWNLLASVCMKNFISMFKWYLYWVLFSW